ncbi:hypothetical protein ACL02T_09640 [Pseudonocardia sp. RS010]|uniref:hypothetical protein n=1 Tax=Pseudonocardia sp. RS010 TaxID=3385979 RepID=UPI00399F35DC
MSRRIPTPRPDTPLAAFRGQNDPTPLSARAITASLEVPGCRRRSLFDAAGISLDRVAPLLGCPSGEQAKHAFSRGNAFETQVMANDGADLIALLREHFSLTIDRVRVADLSSQQVQSAHGGRGRQLNRTRARLTAQHLQRMLTGDPSAPTLLRHALTTLTLGGEPAYLEQDALAVVADGACHIIEIKSFPKIDGRADEQKADAAARQSAVYALSLIEVVGRLGLPAAAVSMQALLVIPENFSLTPVANVIDLTTRVRRLQRSLRQRPTEAELAELLSEGASLPLLPPDESDPSWAAAATQTRQVFEAVPARFGDGCLSCPTFRFCRDEAQRTGAVAQLGTNAINACGSVTSTRTALELAAGRRTPDGGPETALAQHLQRATTIRRAITA